MLIYGKEVREATKEKVKRIAQNKPLSLAVVQVGDEAASGAYINGMKNFGQDIGIPVTVFNYPATISEAELIREIKKLNQSPQITGIMIQKPLPAHMRDDVVVNSLDYRKDVEGIHNFNLGKIINREAGVRPSTPKAVISMLKAHNVPLEGARVTILGRSSILGSPLALMLMAENATVTVCHTRTRNLIDEIRRADIVVAAMGQMNFVTADMVREDTVIIDAGINFDENGKMFGDVHAEAKQKAKMASAVPGGIGVITVAELFDNLTLLGE
ncbi:Tetrahydrofolate dehydrogenase/cyclohydrolase [Syntrophomonas zehnderi OL-4]|uniref:Bifunctional protein FolD n=1 Tax=Syntrophomonas zehnderi OL-4 TaxID=690567 RepID=A0A0E4C9Q9_9FIRM|nr:bifunctional 5,10-methylenetetrahydrofolate dehydrogenase/5,10-methenyltetrahydrofolate cyclohydrolase [Syntrophomonas zehnderi]CFY08271.1 Tetrahydrofolate dehydrogenase/cyclohydrolase [Syntrophomonas zehnderi OL-4]